MQPTDAFIQGRKSVTDITLYGISQFGGSTIVGTTDYFAQNSGSNGKKRTNLPITNSIPANWEYFEVLYIGFKFLGLQLQADIDSAVRDAYFSFVVADYEYKFGHLTELVVPQAYNGYYASTITTSGAPGIGTFQSDARVGGMVPFLQAPPELGGGMLSIPLVANNSFSFKVSFDTDVTNLHSQYAGVYLRGRLNRKIAG